LAVITEVIDYESAIDSKGKKEWAGKKTKNEIKGEDRALPEWRLNRLRPTKRKTRVGLPALPLLDGLFQQLLKPLVFAVFFRRAEGPGYPPHPFKTATFRSL